MENSRLALGTAQFGSNYGVTNREGMPSDAELGRLIEIARATGIDVIDTAATYGNSEERLGRIGVSGLKVVTKLGVPASLSVDNIPNVIVEQINRSLERLRISSLYGVLLHEPEELAGVRRDYIVEGLLRSQREGLSAKIGISAYYPRQLAAAGPVLQGGLAQVPISLFDRRFLGPLVNGCDIPADVEIHARSVFLQGLLLQEPAHLPECFRAWNTLFQAFSEWCRRCDIDKVSACLAIFGQEARISRVVVGVAKPQQLKTILSRFEQARNLPVFPGFSADEKLLVPMNWKKH